MAEKLLDIGEEPWIIVFHAQQSVEKALKAYLIHHNKYFGKVHNMARLIDLCLEIDKDFNHLYEIGADELYPLATEARYPDTEVEVTKDEAEDAVRKAKVALEFIVGKIRQST